MATDDLTTTLFFKDDDDDLTMLPLLLRRALLLGAIEGRAEREVDAALVTALMFDVMMIPLWVSDNVCCERDE